MASALNTPKVKTEIVILVVEDEVAQCKALCSRLKDLGEFGDYRIGQVFSAKNLTEAIEIVRTALPDIVLLDDHIPNGIGEEPLLLADKACAMMREVDPDIPIIVFTGMAGRAPERERRLVGYGQANVYFDKGKDFDTLVNYLNTQLQVREHSIGARFRIGPFDFFPYSFKHHLVLRENPLAVFDLNPMERRLLKFLLDAKGNASSKELILTKLWGYSPSVESHTLETHIARLRKKLRTTDPTLKLIETIQNVGYRLNVGAD